MNIKLGQTYSITNLVTKQTARFVVKELLEYKGHTIIRGITTQHGIFTVRLTVVRERPGVFVLLNKAEKESVVSLSKKLRGLPLALLDYGGVGSNILGVSTVPLTVRAYPFLNSGSPGPMGERVPQTRDEQILRGQKMIDWYLAQKEAK